MASPSLGQDAANYPAPGTILHYDGFSYTADNLVPEPEPKTIEVIADNGELVVFEQCYIISDEEYCSTQVTNQWVQIVYGDFDNGWDGTRNLLDPAQRDADATHITIVNQTGPLTPLEDGREVTWTEQWVDPGYETQYLITVTQRCCATYYHPLAQSDELWEITYTYEGLDDSASSVTEIIYDPVLGVQLRTTEVVQYPDWPDSYYFAELRRIETPAE